MSRPPREPARLLASLPERPKRVAILGSRGIPARYGGFETFAEELGARLVERGIEVTVYCPRRPGPQPTEHRGVRLRHVPCAGKGPLASLVYDLRSLWRARRGHDVVYLLGYGASPFGLLPRLFGTPLWINMDGLEWRRAKWRGLARLWLRLTERVAGLVASRLVFDNAAVAADVLGRLRPRTPSSVIAYGARVEPMEQEPGDVLRSFGLEPDGYHLVVARLEPENRLLETIDAHAASGSTRRLAIVTNLDKGGPLARELEARTGERVALLGPVYDERLDVLRRNARAYVHGHTVGGTNPSLLEAMAAGAVVLAHGNPFNREVLATEGLTFGSTEELASALARVDAMEPAELRRLGAGARERVRTHYGWDRIADAYARLLGLGPVEEPAATVPALEVG